MSNRHRGPARRATAAGRLVPDLATAVRYVAPASRPNWGRVEARRPRLGQDPSAYHLRSKARLPPSSHRRCPQRHARTRRAGGTIARPRAPGNDRSRRVPTPPHKGLFSAQGTLPATPIWRPNLGSSRSGHARLRRSRSACHLRSTPRFPPSSHRSSSGGTRALNERGKLSPPGRQGMSSQHRGPARRATAPGLVSGPSSGVQ
jgi:hypothetical protein